MKLPLPDPKRVKELLLVIEQHPLGMVLLTIFVGVAGVLLEELMIVLINGSSENSLSAMLQSISGILPRRLAMVELPAVRTHAPHQHFLASSHKASGDVVVFEIAAAATLKAGGGRSTTRRRRALAMTLELGRAPPHRCNFATG